MSPSKIKFEIDINNDELLESYGNHMETYKEKNLKGEGGVGFCSN
jgi:hypothetical protein